MAATDKPPCAWADGTTFDFPSAAPDAWVDDTAMAQLITDAIRQHGFPRCTRAGWISITVMGCFDGRWRVNYSCSGCEAV